MRHTQLSSAAAQLDQRAGETRSNAARSRGNGLSVRAQPNGRSTRLHLHTRPASRITHQLTLTRLTLPSTTPQRCALARRDMHASTTSLMPSEVLRPPWIS